MSGRASERDDASQQRQAPVAVWGLGYIGATTTLALLDYGSKVVAVDPSPKRRQELSSAPLVLNSTHDLAIDFREHLRSGRLTVVSRPNELLSHRPTTHFFCFPTEQNGQPHSQHLVAALDWTSQHSYKSIIIIESTIAPAWISDFRISTRNVVIAPRRDWFHSPDHTLQTLTRVCAASSPAVQLEANRLLGSISPSIVWSSDLVAAAASKAFENSLWFVMFTLVNELAANAEDVNFSEVLRLSRTNWRTPFDFEPAYRVGGYCLPLSSEYLSKLSGSTADERPLSHVLVAAKMANEYTTDRIHERVVESVRRAPGPVLVLGISYRPGLKVSTYSAGSTLAQRCIASGLDVLAHDPLYSEEELRQITDATPVDLQTGLSTASCLIACTAHPDFDAISRVAAIPPNIKAVFDSIGMLDVQEARDASFDYYRLGDDACKRPPSSATTITSPDTAGQA